MRRVYFIKPIGMDGPIKIGCSCSPDNRRETLELWCPFPLEVLAEIEGDFALERRFHTVFANHWKGREWFHPSPELYAVIDAINAGTFDVSALPPPASLNHFRKPRRNTAYSPEWRYKASVTSRMRHRGEYPYWSAAFKTIVGGDLHCDWLPHREAIEALIATMPPKRRAAA